MGARRRITRILLYGAAGGLVGTGIGCQMGAGESIGKRAQATNIEHCVGAMNGSTNVQSMPIAFVCGSLTVGWSEDRFQEDPVAYSAELAIDAQTLRTDAEPLDNRGEGARNGAIAGGLIMLGVGVVVDSERHKKGLIPDAPSAATPPAAT